MCNAHPTNENSHQSTGFHRSGHNAMVFVTLEELLLSKSETAARAAAPVGAKGSLLCKRCYGLKMAFTDAERMLACRCVADGFLFSIAEESSSAKTFPDDDTDSGLGDSPPPSPAWSLTSSNASSSESSTSSAGEGSTLFGVPFEVVWRLQADPLRERRSPHCYSGRNYVRVPLHSSTTTCVERDQERNDQVPSPGPQ